MCDFLIQKLFQLGFGCEFQNSFVRRSSDMISPFHSNLDSCKVASVPIQAFADSSRDGTVERRARAMRADTLMHLVESAAVGCTLQLTLGAEINKQLQLIIFIHQHKR